MQEPCRARRTAGLRWATSLWVGLLVACGSSGDSDNAEPPSPPAPAARAKVSLEAPGPNCVFGGTRVDAGQDAGANGQLDVAEVSGTQYVCNARPGLSANEGTSLNALVRVDAEAAGANCAAGGWKASAGLDANASGALDTAEVASTGYVCNSPSGSHGSHGTPGPSRLVVMAREAAGANCAHGGKKVTTGLDSNGDRVLSLGEVTTTDYVCNGGAGSGIAWASTTGTAQAMAANTGYLANNGALVTFTLPANPAIGTLVAVTGVGAGGWRIAQNAGQFITARAVANDLPAGTVWQQTGLSLSFGFVASSADGVKLLAAGIPDRLYTSADAGATWQARTSTPEDWSAVASSADGTKLVATQSPGLIYTSSDSGATWAASTHAAVNTPRAWSTVASSADGTRLVAAVWGGAIFTSSDSGATWTERPSVAAQWWTVASSADGSKLLATAYNGGYIYTSTDYGATWTQRAFAADWKGAASSADGSKLVALASGDHIYTSADAGATWTARAGVATWGAVASSADGTYLVAGPENAGGPLHVSRDAGLTWVAQANTNIWTGLASSSDGSRLAAATYSGVLQLSVAGRSTVGTAGSVSGNTADSLTLQYAGGGEFVVVEHALGSPLRVQ